MRYGLEILDVERPGRYEGIEAGATIKDWAETPLRIALLFPDVYEIGMSHLGLPILYRALNSMEGVVAERAYAPWRDMEAHLRRKGLPVLSRETSRPLSDFDLLGFTLQYELSITNVLSMLELGGVSLLAKDRAEKEPLVIGGGPVAANPEPYADFFDAFFIGEGEEGVKEIAAALLEAKKRGDSRAQKLEALGKVEGVYLPSQNIPLFEGEKFSGFSKSRKAKRRIVADLDKSAPPPKPILPFGISVHDRLSVEVARGCTRGCRFCQAGFLYRPVRERSAKAILSSVTEGLCTGGHEEVGLLSLSTGDYSSIGPLLVSLMEEHKKDKVSVSLPSLRVDSFDGRLLTEVAKVRKTGFTLAPEAGSQTLRDRINKHFTDDEILASVEKVFAAGWKGVKLYFMVGLPFETPEDREAIVSLAQKISRAAPPKARVTVSVSNFVPKPHTPFQWARQLGEEELIQIQRGLLDSFARLKKVDFKRHDPAVSVLEGVMARGDRRIGKAILRAYELGARMDGWSSEFKKDIWAQAFAESGLETVYFLREREAGEPLPWDNVDIGVTKDYFLSELEKAAAGGRTPDCRREDCSMCGVCDFKAITPKNSPPLDYPDAAKDEAPAQDFDEQFAPRLRFRWSKSGPASFLSHLDAASALLRAMRASGVQILYSHGFNPHPKLRLGPALSLGTESLAELGEIKVKEIPPLAKTVEEINSRLPEGLKIDLMWVVDSASGGLPSGSTLEEYSLWPSEEAQAAAGKKGGWEKVFADFIALPSFALVKKRVGKPDRSLEAMDFVKGLWLRPDGSLGFLMRRSPDGGMVAPELLLNSLLGLGDEHRALKRILKIKMDIPREEK